MFRMKVKIFVESLTCLFGPIVLVYICYLVYALFKMFISWNLYKPLYPFSGEHLIMDRVLILFGFFYLVYCVLNPTSSNDDWDRCEGEF